MKFTLCAFADEAGADVQEQIRALKENQIPYLEIRGVGDKNITGLTLQQAEEFKEILERQHVVIWSIGSPLGKIGVTENFGPHLDLFKRTLELARIFEAPCIRLFSFYIPSGEDAAVYRDEVMERLSRFCEAAKGSGVHLCHENEKGIYGDIASRCLDIHQSIEGLEAVFDPANFIQCGQDTLKAWRLLFPYVKYLHIKDAESTGRIVPAGQGTGHLPELLKLYENQGGRVLTLEPHLAVFSGLEALEREGKRIVDAYTYPSQRAAFDTAVSALKNLIVKGD